jgi:hypothetical protein
LKFGGKRIPKELAMKLQKADVLPTAEGLSSWRSGHRQAYEIRLHP